MEKKNEILDLSFEFALEIITFTELLEERRKYVIAKQLLRSGTSIGANVREGQSPHSRADFAAKMIIALKEAEESEYWLLLCKFSKNYPDVETEELLLKIASIKKLLGKIVSSTKRF